MFSLSFEALASHWTRHFTHQLRESRVSDKNIFSESRDKWRSHVKIKLSRFSCFLAWDTAWNEFFRQRDFITEAPFRRRSYEFYGFEIICKRVKLPVVSQKKNFWLNFLFLGLTTFVSFNHHYHGTFFWICTQFFLEKYLRCSQTRQQKNTFGNRSKRSAITFLMIHSHRPSTVDWAFTC